METIEMALTTFACLTGARYMGVIFVAWWVAAMIHRHTAWDGDVARAMAFCDWGGGALAVAALWMHSGRYLVLDLALACIGVWAMFYRTRSRLQHHYRMCVANACLIFYVIATNT